MAPVSFRIENGTVTVHPADADTADPALARFLDLLARDSANRPEASGPFPNALLARIERLTAGVAVDLDAPIEGDVMLQRHGWTLFAHPLFLDQLDRLIAAAARARRANPRAGRATPMSGCWRRYANSCSTECRATRSPPNTVRAIRSGPSIGIGFVRSSGPIAFACAFVPTQRLR